MGDLGWGVFDRHFRDFPKQTYNTGAAEQALLDIACGMAVSGKIPIVYSITSFLLFRPFECIRTYINYESLNVKLIGSGRDKDYLHDGISHYSMEDRQLMALFPNIHAVWPETKEEIPALVDTMIKDNNPWYINLRR